MRGIGTAGSRTRGQCWSENRNWPAGRELAAAAECSGSGTARRRPPAEGWCPARRCFGRFSEPTPGIAAKNRWRDRLRRRTPERYGYRWKVVILKIVRLLKLLRRL